MTMDEAIEHVRGKLDGLAARIKELEAENAELERIAVAQSVQIASLQEDAARIDRLSEIRRFGKPGAWSTVLLALRETGDGKSLRQAIDAATKGEAP